MSASPKRHNWCTNRRTRRSVPIVSQFRVDPAALQAAGDYLDDIGGAVGNLNVVEALEACNSIGTEATSAATQQVALKLGAAVAGCAVDTVALASKTGETHADCAAIDDGVAASLRRLDL